jgi:glycosyltransferase involved in cell wall biosynthesis
VGGQARPFEQTLRRNLEKSATAHRISDRVRFLGERRDVGDILYAADIYCQPNTAREGFGIGLVEAMSRGLPIVATDLGATADPVGPEIGLRVGVEPDQLAAALAALIEDRARRESLGSAAHARYVAHFSPEAALEEFATALQENAQVKSSSEGASRWA